MDYEEVGTFYIKGQLCRFFINNYFYRIILQSYHRILSFSRGSQKIEELYDFETCKANETKDYYLYPTIHAVSTIPMEVLRIISMVKFYTIGIANLRVLERLFRKYRR